MIFWRGYRLRVPLYAESFRKGIDKTTSVITQSISVLDNNADMVIERTRSFLPPSKAEPKLTQIKLALTCSKINTDFYLHQV